MDALLVAFSVWNFLSGLVFFLFVLVSLLLILIILLQEPKGGGLSGAFGGAGAETFGVQTGGVNKFTSYLAGIFLLLAIFYAIIPHEEDGSILDTDGEPAITDTNSGDEDK
ncbi:MAG: preprotein translocase subunit SecG [Planctomycetota bacterium]